MPRMTDTAIRNVKPGEEARKLFDAGGVHFLVRPRASSVAGAVRLSPARLDNVVYFEVGSNFSSRN